MYFDSWTKTYPFLKVNSCCADLLKSMQAQMGGPWAQARNFAVITGVHAGIAAAVRRVRKKDDTYTALVTSAEQSKPRMHLPELRLCLGCSLDSGDEIGST